MMKVLFQSRGARSLASAPGGDLVQLVNTAQRLRERGVEVDISDELEPALDGYDAVHLFNIVRPQEVWPQAKNAARQDKHIILSTVYCDVWEFERSARPGLLGHLARRSNRDVVEAAKALARAVSSRELHRGVIPLLTTGYATLQRAIAALTDLFLPNSHSEMARLQRDLGVTVAADRVFKVPNGVDVAFFDPSQVDRDAPPPHLAECRDCVLCVARIGGPKNQLTLVRAARTLPFKVVIAGAAGPNQRRYWQRLARESGANVRLVGFVTEEEKRWLYHLARVHVLPSWMETTGLTSLEAAAMGCNLVITDKGDAREYFDGFAEYCDPADEGSVAAAIARAHAAPLSEALQAKVRGDFTWERAADCTLRAYELAMTRRPVGSR
jgi:glycosyltransferase involved in cell wall biosynthesis